MDLRSYRTLLENIHTAISLPSDSGQTFLCKGKIKYFHYNCDEINDVGWGCGYRTLQSVCSWILNEIGDNLCDKMVPSIPQIQRILVNISDKQRSFLNSREWIGVLEAFYVIDALFNIPCKIHHISKSDDIEKHVPILTEYFQNFGGMIMMGGDLDASSKGIAGVHIAGNDVYFLIVDPHFNGNSANVAGLINDGFVRWQHISEFEECSFYNLCLPLIKKFIPQIVEIITPSHVNLFSDDDPGGWSLLYNKRRQMVGGGVMIWTSTGCNGNKSTALILILSTDKTTESNELSSVISYQEGNTPKSKLPEMQLIPFFIYITNLLFTFVY